MHTIRSWCRANAMLVISLLAAAATAFFVPPDSAPTTARTLNRQERVLRS